MLNRVHSTSLITACSNTVYYTNARLLSDLKRGHRDDKDYRLSLDTTYFRYPSCILIAHSVTVCRYERVTVEDEYT